MSACDIEIEDFRQQYLIISQDMKLIFNILNLVIISSAALIGYGFTSNNPYVFLTPFLISIPSAYLMSSNMDEIIYSAAYIVYKIESINPNVKCCTYMFEFRKIREESATRSNGHIPFLNIFYHAPDDARAYFLILTCLSGVYIALFLTNLGELNYLILLFIAVLFILQLWICRKLLTAYTSMAEKRYLELFRQIDERLKA